MNQLFSIEQDRTNRLTAIDFAPACRSDRIERALRALLAKSAKVLYVFAHSELVELAAALREEQVSPDFKSPRRRS